MKKIIITINYEGSVFENLGDYNARISNDEIGDLISKAYHIDEIQEKRSQYAFALDNIIQVLREQADINRMPVLRINRDGDDTTPQ